MLGYEYHKFLTRIDWTDNLFLSGTKEGRNKFLTSTFLSILRVRGIHKYHRTHLVSLNARQQLAQKSYKGLVYEHVVPKERHIQTICEEKARLNEMTP